ncbi:hypothetical protein ZPR_0722 [Zunongwangia profunda SM-A87]|uniref:Uncharacterized protein n=1 Tax=Zunongwangia profunda (strain DSM 18752 / CCTCC AB 206139 / SM-A87) TaxID=655815 RepID=D5BGB3_ZUNPS|nr:hypothetical protein ZPR_0722 [Zunongwangia profunda SM-A87]
MERIATIIVSEARINPAREIDAPIILPMIDTLTSFLLCTNSKKENLEFKIHKTQIIAASIIDA